MSDELDLSKLQIISNRLGKESGELGVKLFHKSITEFSAMNIQRQHCINIVKNDGLGFAAQVYHTVYAIITSINSKREKEGSKPLGFYTEGMDKYFQCLGIPPYNVNDVK